MGRPDSEAAPTTTWSANTEKLYWYWQNRILYSALIGYALYYFVRQNLSVAMPEIEKDLGIKKIDLGIFITLNGLMYGLSKFVNGIFVDRMNARWFMAAGLGVSALLNFAFGASSSTVALGMIWMFNGWFQGLGFPPAARLMTHWFPPRILATKMSIWNVSHSVGAGLVVVMCGYLVKHFGNWRLCFYVPAGIALAGMVFLLVCLRDTPESLGLPEVEGTDHLPASGTGVAGVWNTLTHYVFTNPYIWLISFANFFVYVVRYGLVSWGPTFLKEAKHLTPEQGGWIVGAIEFAGVFGMLAGGWVTDRFFGGRGTRTCLFCMLLCAACLAGFQALPEGTPFAIEATLMIAAGFAMYGPQCLIGIIAANLATKKAAATAGGLTGMFGYFSSTVAGVGVGVLVETHGWDAGYSLFIASSLIGALLFAACWKAPAHGYHS